MTIALQPFKETDTEEPKFRDSALPVLETLEAARDEFYAGAFEAAPLGDVLYALTRDPMTDGVLTLEIYRKSFWAIHQLFTRPGTFEFYMEVFKAIWGEDVDVEFVNPAAGVLQINIGEIVIESFAASFRAVESDVYVYYAAVTEAGEELLFQDTVGTKNQSEVDALIAEISPAGIYVTATLTL